MSGEWCHLGEMPTEARILGDGGEPIVEALRGPRAGELVVRVLAAWSECWNHAPAGGVVEVIAAQDTDELVPGDRLLVFDRAPCGHCETCRRGHGTHCPDAERILVPSFRRDLMILPAWIARRGRVRLPQRLSDAAALQLGMHSWILRGLKSMLDANPLRILVIGEGESADMAGLLLEIRWPDSRRVLLGRSRGVGYHAVVDTEASALDALGQPADLVVALASNGLSRMLVAAGAKILVLEGAKLADALDLWALEVTVQGSRGALPADVDAWRKYFEPFSERWESDSAD